TLHRVRARFEHGQDPVGADALAQTLDRRTDGGRMVREIVIQRDTARFPAHLHPSPYAGEPAQGVDCDVRLYTDVARCSYHGKRVQLVVRAELLPPDAADRLVLPRDLEASVASERARLPGARRGKPLHRRPNPMGEYTLQCFIAPVDHQAP